MIHRRLPIRVMVAAILVLSAEGRVALMASGQATSAPAGARADGQDQHAQRQSDGDMASMPGMEMPGTKMPGVETPPSTPAAPEGLSAVSIGPAIQQRIGVTLGRAQVTPLVMRIRTVGIVKPNETTLAHVHLKTEGWVTKLFVSFTGQKVKAGDPLLAIYSPAFFGAQREFLVALQAAKVTPSPDQQTVVDAARLRLELWGVPKEEIESLEKTGKALTTLTLRSPIGGTVLEKKAFEGQYVTPQDELYLVADLSTVWVQAKVYEYELPHIELNMAVAVILPAFPGRELGGKVAFIDPTVEEPSRTVGVRIELPNDQNQLKPGMFANILISHTMGQGLTVPSSAVIRTGRRNIVYRVEGQDRFVPLLVVVSPSQFEDRFQVLQGLKAGDMVVTSANFLIDSESRLRAGESGMAGMPGMEGMQMGSAKPGSATKSGPPAKEAAPANKGKSP
ncbi:MAG: efflux RND transporter periplasmic adaptor subunit [Planctomycetes bacterium]|nr:efflux RND transporter periplasmic adaptor subunit [Planctomycetota bacterium]